MEERMRNSLMVLALVTLPLLPASAEAQHIVTYARLGYGSVFADSTRRAPAVGFGIRAEVESFGIDISALNMTLKADLQETLTNVAGGSLLKLEVLRFLRPDASRSAYVGGGLSWGAVSVGRGTQYGSGVISAISDEHRLIPSRSAWGGIAGAPSGAHAAL
jgi:hypothetical protein